MKTKFKTNYLPNKTEKFINDKKCNNMKYFSMMYKTNSFIHGLNQYNEHNEILNRNIQNIVDEEKLFKIIGISLKINKKNITTNELQLTEVAACKNL